MCYVQWIHVYVHLSISVLAYECTKTTKREKENRAGTKWKELIRQCLFWPMQSSLSLCPFSPCFFSVSFRFSIFWVSAQFVVSTYCPYLSSFFILCLDSLSCFLISLLLSAYLPPSLLLVCFTLSVSVSIALQPDSVPWWRKVWFLMPAGWETEILKD